MRYAGLIFGGLVGVGVGLSAFAQDTAPPAATVAPSVSTAFPNGDHYVGPADYSGDSLWTFADGTRLKVKDGKTIYTFADGSKAEISGTTATLTDVAGNATPAEFVDAREAKVPSVASIFPARQAQSKFIGTTALSILITEKGESRDIQIVRSSGKAAMDQAAVNRFAGTLWQPATVNGRPIKRVGHPQIVWNIK